MSHRTIVFQRRGLVRTVVLGAALATGACAEHLSRHESVEYSAGDAVAANKVLQIIDPWDRRAAWTDIDQDGQRAVDVVEAYRTGETSESTEGGSIADSGGSLTQE